MKKLISSESEFEKNIAYSRAVVKGNWVFVSGTTGFNYKNNTIENDIVSQTDQCFKNISEALTKADSKLEDVVRVTYILKDASEFEKCWPTMRQYFGDIRPSATMFAADLADSKMKIEIQVTALKD